MPGKAGNTPGRHMAKEVPLQNRGRSTAPGHMDSPGIAHSSKAKISSQKFHKKVLHYGSHSLVDLKPTVPVGL